MKFGISFGQCLDMHGKLYDVYVMYDPDSDGSFVENELMPMLEENKLKVPNMECPTLGQDQFSSLEAMLNQSCSALIVLSQKFLKSRWNLYDLSQVVMTEIHHKNFKVGFLLCQRLENMDIIPQNLRLVLGTTVKKYKGNWQNLLVYH